MANRKSWASWFPIAAKPHNVGFRMSDAEYERQILSLVGPHPQRQSIPQSYVDYIKKHGSAGL